MQAARSRSHLCGAGARPRMRARARSREVRLMRALRANRRPRAPRRRRSLVLMGSSPFKNLLGVQAAFAPFAMPGVDLGAAKLLYTTLSEARWAWRSRARCGPAPRAVPPPHSPLAPTNHPPARLRRPRRLRRLLLEAARDGPHAADEQRLDLALARAHAGGLQLLRRRARHCVERAGAARGCCPHPSSRETALHSVQPVAISGVQGRPPSAQPPCTPNRRGCSRPRPTGRPCGGCACG